MVTVDTRPTTTTGEGLRLGVVGEIDIASASELRTGFDRAIGQAGDLAVALSGVTFIDSYGVALLVETHRRLADRGGRLSLVAPSADVRLVLELMGLDRVLELA